MHKKRFKTNLSLAKVSPQEKRDEFAGRYHLSSYLFALQNKDGKNQAGAGSADLQRCFPTLIILGHRDKYDQHDKIPLA